MPAWAVLQKEEDEHGGQHDAADDLEHQWRAGEGTLGDLRFERAELGSQVLAPGVDARPRQAEWAGDQPVFDPGDPGSDRTPQRRRLVGDGRHDPSQHASERRQCREQHRPGRSEWGEAASPEQRGPPARGRSPSARRPRPARSRPGSGRRARLRRRQPARFRSATRRSARSGRARVHSRGGSVPCGRSPTRRRSARPCRGRRGAEIGRVSVGRISVGRHDDQPARRTVRHQCPRRVADWNDTITSPDQRPLRWPAGAAPDAGRDHRSPPGGDESTDDTIVSSRSACSRRVDASSVAHPEFVRSRPTKAAPIP